jgi:hypothetical protein
VTGGGGGGRFVAGGVAQADEACAGGIRSVHGGVRDQVLQPRGRAAHPARQPDSPALPVLDLQVRTPGSSLQLAHVVHCLPRRSRHGHVTSSSSCCNTGQFLLRSGAFANLHAAH